jgi:hypothetical protein
MWGALAAVFNLDHPGHFISWGWFQISLANLIVIILMIVTFIAAIFIPFPGKDKRRGGEQ